MYSSLVEETFSVEGLFVLVFLISDCCFYNKSDKLVTIGGGFIPKGMSQIQASTTKIEPLLSPNRVSNRPGHYTGRGHN